MCIHKRGYTPAYARTREAARFPVSGFHPEQAVSRWRDMVRVAATPRDELNARMDAVLAMAALLCRRGEQATADRLRQQAADALGALFEEYAPGLENAHATQDPASNATA